MLAPNKCLCCGHNVKSELIPAKRKSMCDECIRAFADALDAVENDSEEVNLCQI